MIDSPAIATWTRGVVVHGPGRPATGAAIVRPAIGRRSRARVGAAAAAGSPAADVSA